MNRSCRPRRIEGDVEAAALNSKHDDVLFYRFLFVRSASTPVRSIYSLLSRDNLQISYGTSIISLDDLD
jgi:hypothetical protein